MDKTQQAAQLRLAADILETGHPWEMKPSFLRGSNWRKSTPQQMPDYSVAHGYEIRLALATPPDGRALHNPDNLTAGQVEAGWRLVLVGEGRHVKAEVWMAKNWQERGIKADTYLECFTYRVPLSVPWPEAEKPDPYAELKKARAEGRVIQSFNRERSIWQDCPSPAFEGGTEYRIKPDAPAFQLPPPPPGMQWHRTDGWEEGDLPQGWRPLVEGEKRKLEDEWTYNDGNPWRSVRNFGPAGAVIVATSAKHRTRRPLTFMREGEEWTYHRPGDPMPCDGEKLVSVLFQDGDALDANLPASDWKWGAYGQTDTIIGWRYADEKKTVPLGPEDVKPFTVIRRKGEAQTWHWRTVSYVDAVKVTCGNRVYGWDELASSYERNESLPLTGKWNPSAWEPCSKPA